MELRHKSGATAFVRVATAVVLCLFAVQLFAAAPAPRALSEAERAGVEIAAAYLSGGPEEIAKRLSAKSGLLSLPKEQLLQEIEIRLGPPAGATWELATVFPKLANDTVVFEVEFPSGADDSVIFDMKQDGTSYTIDNIRNLSMPVERPVKLQVAASTARVDTGSELSELLAYAPLVFGVLAALTGLIGAFMARGGPGTRRAVAMTAIVLAIGGSTAAAIKGWTIPEEAKAVEVKSGVPDAAKTAQLLGVRRALASGGTTDASKPGPIDSDPRIGTTATLWHAQLALQNRSADEMTRLLKKLPATSDIPLAETLRARAALLRNDEVAAAVAYENAISLGPGRDSLWNEAAQVTLTLGFEERARRYFDRLIKNGSRDAQIYYAGSILASMKKDDEGAKKLLETAWNMQPIERADLVEAAVFWKTLRAAGSNHFINLSTPTEATFASPEVSSRPITIPADATSRVSGQLLSIKVGDRELLVPGGAPLAPIGTPAVDAGTWSREEEEKGLADFANIVSAAKSPSAYAQPALKQRILRAATALERHNRWADLLQLTEGADPKAEHVPAEMFFLRNSALQRAGRNDEARKLVEQLTVSRAIKRKNDVNTLLELGELLAEHDLYDAAIKILERAHSLEPNESTDMRIRQITMNKRLSTKYSSIKTPHFTIRYPEDVTPASATAIGHVLEAELHRLQKWVPVAEFQPITVNVVWWDEFVTNMTGTEYILGFFQKGITVPFAGLPSMFPEAVGILSHELCHAMIAQATGDQAPRWFHEGLASRIEMRDYHENAFTLYEDDKLLALSLIDPVIGGSPDPSMITQGYVQSQTTIRYIEAVHGLKGLHSLLGAFRNGATTEEAIAQVSGKSMPQFEASLRSWGRAGDRTFENPPAIRYDNATDGTLRWSIPEKKSAVLGRTQ